MPPPPPMKRRKVAHGNNNHHHNSKPSTSINNLKKKVRDLERLLARPNSNLTANGRVENERALQAYRHELGHASKSKKEQTIAKKYHMVRFFERVKATRKVNKARRELQAHDKPTEEVRKKLHDAEVELNYALYYPKGEKYISLFKDPGEKIAEKRESIKADVARRMVTNTLGARTMDDREARNDDERRQYNKDKATGESKRKRKTKLAEVEPANIEDDFFEF